MRSHSRDMRGLSVCEVVYCFLGVCCIESVSLVEMFRDHLQS